VQGKGESKKEAKEAAAKAMLQQIGPYIEDEEWIKYVHSIESQNERKWDIGDGGILKFQFSSKVKQILKQHLLRAQKINNRKK
jgi:hypothetical protein